MLLHVREVGLVGPNALELVVGWIGQPVEGPGQAPEVLHVRAGGKPRQHKVSCGLLRLEDPTSLDTHSRHNDLNQLRLRFQLGLVSYSLSLYSVSVSVSTSSSL